MKFTALSLVGAVLAACGDPALPTPKPVEPTVPPKPTNEAVPTQPPDLRELPPESTLAPQVLEATAPPEPTSVPPTPDFWVGKEYPAEMPRAELYARSLEVIISAQRDPNLTDMKFLNEVLLPVAYTDAVYRAIATDQSGEITDPEGTPTGYGTSLMFTTQAELGWGDDELVFGITQGHIFLQEASGRSATGLILRQRHLAKGDIEIPHVTWSSIDGLDASVFAFRKPEGDDIKTYGLDNFAYGVTKDNLNLAKGLVMPASNKVTGFMGAYGTPDRTVIPPYSDWPRGMHIRTPSSQGCSGSALLDDAGKVFATAHAVYPTAIQDPGNPDKYVYDSGFGTFADIIPSQKTLLLAAIRAQMDYKGKWG